MKMLGACRSMHALLWPWLDLLAGQQAKASDSAIKKAMALCGVSWTVFIGMALVATMYLVSMCSFLLYGVVYFTGGDLSAATSTISTAVVGIIAFSQNQRSSFDNDRSVKATAQHIVDHIQAMFQTQSKQYRWDVTQQALTFFESWDKKTPS